MSPEPKKKPGLALVISMGKGKGDDHGEPDGDEADGDMPDEFRATADELADVLAVDDSKRDEFASSLYAAIHSAK